MLINTLLTANLPIVKGLALFMQKSRYCPVNFIIFTALILT
jgi:hypothetical protein